MYCSRVSLPRRYLASPLPRPVLGSRGYLWVPTSNRHENLDIRLTPKEVTVGKLTRKNSPLAVSRGGTLFKIRSRDALLALDLLIARASSPAQRRSPHEKGASLLQHEQQSKSICAPRVGVWGVMIRKPIPAAAEQLCVCSSTEVFETRLETKLCFEVLTPSHALVKTLECTRNNFVFHDQ